MDINENLKLKDYKKIRTPFVFLDETGSINDKNNQYFGLGILKVMQPHFLDSKIRSIRQKHGFYDEIKWNKISRKNYKVIENIIDEIFLTPGIKFSSIVIDKNNIDFEKDFNNNPYQAYQDFSEILLCKSIKYTEILVVLADYISTPNNIHYEVDLKHKINQKFERLAIAGIHRVDSNGINLIQVVDILLGSVVYEYKHLNKLVNGDKYKIKIYKHLLNKLEIKTFRGGLKLRDFRVIEYQ